MKNAKPQQIRSENMCILLEYTFLLFLIYQYDVTFQEIMGKFH